MLGAHGKSHCIVFYLSSDISVWAQAWRKIDQAASSAVPSRQCRFEKMVGMQFVVDAVEKYAGELFRLWLDPRQETSEHKHPALELLYDYWGAISVSTALADQHADKVCLTLFAELVHRFWLKHRCEPYRSCPLPGVFPEPSKAQFLTASRTPTCCRRNSLALVQYSKLGIPDTSPLQLYGVVFHQWNARVQPATIPVEKIHCEQRNRLRKWQRESVSFARQAGAEVCQHLQKIWFARGGRHLHLLNASYQYAKDMSEGKKSQQDGPKRPNQFGNLAYSWISGQMTEQDCNLALAHDRAPFS